MEEDTVLVTGGTGYIAQWVILELLKRGYRVRTTVRDLAREPTTRAVLASHSANTDHLTFMAANLLEDAGWDRAVSGAEYVIHVASPMPTREYRGQDLNTPAREGTRRVVEAALRSGVRRVVFTSSSNVASPAESGDTLSDESIWANADDPSIGAYTRSKVLAERLAWDLASTSSGTTLTSILPGMVLGPVLGQELTGSLEFLAGFFRGRMRRLARFGEAIVDVRDLAAVHVDAMTHPQAAGERFLCTGDFLWFREIAGLLKSEFPEAADLVSLVEAEDERLLRRAQTDPDLQFMAAHLGHRREFSGAKAERLLGWRARPAAETVREAGRSLIASGLL